MIHQPRYGVILTVVRGPAELYAKLRGLADHGLNTARIVLLPYPVHNHLLRPIQQPQRRQIKRYRSIVSHGVNSLNALINLRTCFP